MYQLTVNPRTFKLRIAMVAMFLTAMLFLALESRDLAYWAWIIVLVMGVLTGNLREERALLSKTSSIAALLTFMVTLWPYVPVDMRVVVYAPVIGAAIYVSRVTSAQEWLLVERYFSQRVSGKR